MSFTYPSRETSHRPPFKCATTYIRRPDGSLTPLIAADELPPGVVLSGAPRKLTELEAAQMRFAGDSNEHASLYSVHPSQGRCPVSGVDMRNRQHTLYNRSIQPPRGSSPAPFMSQTSGQRVPSAPIASVSSRPIFPTGGNPVMQYQDLQQAFGRPGGSMPGVAGTQAGQYQSHPMPRPSVTTSSAPPVSSSNLQVSQLPQPAPPAILRPHAIPIRAPPAENAPLEVTASTSSTASATHDDGPKSPSPNEVAHRAGQSSYLPSPQVSSQAVTAGAPAQSPTESSSTPAPPSSHSEAGSKIGLKRVSSNDVINAMIGFDPEVDALYHGNYRYREKRKGKTVPRSSTNAQEFIGPIPKRKFGVPDIPEFESSALQPEYEQVRDVEPREIRKIAGVLYVNGRPVKDVSHLPRQLSTSSAQDQEEADDGQESYDEEPLQPLDRDVIKKTLASTSPISGPITTSPSSHRSFSPAQRRTRASQSSRGRSSRKESQGATGERRRGRNPTGKEHMGYCLYWLKNGTCGLQPHCVFPNHKMPDLETLRKIGIPKFPNWWIQEQREQEEKDRLARDNEETGNVVTYSPYRETHKAGLNRSSQSPAATSPQDETVGSLAW